MSRSYNNKRKKLENKARTEKKRKLEIIKKKNKKKNKSTVDLKIRRITQVQQQVGSIALSVTGGLAADDLTVVGVADNLLIPIVVIGGGAIIGGIELRKYMATEGYIYIDELSLSQNIAYFTIYMYEKENILYASKNEKNKSKGKGGSKGGIPVKNKTTASNGLDYQSNGKHTPGQPGNRPNAGVEPKNSLDLFGNSKSSPNSQAERFTYDKETNTLHRFFNDGNGTWHWSGSTNQGANSLRGRDVPNDIKNIFDLPKKGW